MGSEWRSCTLGDVIELKRGYDLPKLQRKNGQVPIISSSGVTDYHCLPMAKAPGVITGRYGTIGEVFFTNEDYWPLNTTLYVKDFKGNDPEYIYYFLKTIPYAQYSDKAAVPGINRNHLHMANVFVPAEISEQKRIAQLLSSLDNKITLNRQLNQTLEQMAQALFKSWFVDFDPVIDNALAAANAIPDDLQDRAERRQLQLAKADHKPLPENIRKLFPSEFELTESLGWVPRGWEVSSAEHEFAIKGGGTPSTANADFWEGGDICWSSPKDLSGNTSKILLDTEKKVTQLGLEKISSGLLPVNTVLMSSRAPVGYLALAKVPVAINQGYIALICNGTLTPEYTIQWLASIMDTIQGMAGGTTFAEISKKTFKSISLLVPSKEVVLAFGDVAEKNYEAIAKNVTNSKILERIRDSLLPKLISGEIRIGELENV